MCCSIVQGHKQPALETSVRDLFALSNLYLLSFPSSHVLLTLRALIGENQNNLLVVFLGLTLL